MGIVHICLANFYIENMEYQENVLPRKHKELGHDVVILTSQYDFDSKGTKKTRNSGEYINEDGIKVIILPYNDINLYLSIRLRLYSNLYKTLDRLDPDILFIHGTQSFSMFTIIKYKKRHPKVRIFADQHGDFYNMPVNTMKDIIKHKYIFGIPSKMINKYLDKFWGVTPWRVEYLKKVYRIPENKTGLLVMGGDENKIDFQNQISIKERLRITYGIKHTDFLIITGGKIDKAKNIHLLVEAVSKINNNNLKLVIFGDVKPEVAEIFNKFKSDKVIKIGWIQPEDVYNWFLSSDLAIFPGTHSVLWEQACACGLPSVFKDWEGMHHVDIGGNCKFLHEDSAEEIKHVISEIVSNRDEYDNMKKVAIEKGIKKFAYREIARRAIGIE